MSTDRHLKEDDIALFRREVGGVDRLRHDKVAPDAARPRPVPRQKLEDRRRVMEELLTTAPEDIDVETGEELVFLRDGTRPAVLRKLRRGQFSVAAELDLHGMTSVQAKEALRGFFKECEGRDLRCVRIIHGKGLGSRDGRPVLKGMLDRWLRIRDEVVAFCSARAVDGGTGAAYVLLKWR